LDDLTRDFKYGFRALARDPGFAAVALITLALGLGANTLIFSVINSVLLKALPHPEPDRLVVLDEYREHHGSRTVSWMDFQDWHEQNRVFEDIAAYRLVDTSLTGHDEALTPPGRGSLRSLLQDSRNTAPARPSLY
jgi:putative ABC transport system permease protein